MYRKSGGRREAGGGMRARVKCEMNVVGTEKEKGINKFPFPFIKWRDGRMSHEPPASPHESLTAKYQPQHRMIE